MIFGYSNTFGGYAGGQAEYLRVPYANVGPIIVPEELEDEQVVIFNRCFTYFLLGCRYRRCKTR